MRLLKIALAVVAALCPAVAFALDDSAIPPKFPIPWGNAASGSFIRPIPVPSQIGIQNGAASLTDGFPPLNFTPVGAGGVPPFGQDMNGILNQLSAWSRWQNAGGPVAYDATFSAAIGGYPKGAVLSSATFGGYWLSTVDSNTSNPDTGGANWYGFFVNKGPTRTTLTTGSVSPYTPPTGVVRLFVRQIGGGAGGGGGGSSVSPGATGTNGGDTTFNGVTAKGGTAGSGGGISGSGIGGSGGTGGTGAAALRQPCGSGSVGLPAGTVNFGAGGIGAGGPFGGAGANTGSSSVAAVPNTGAGGAGGPTLTSGAFGGGGGGCGEYVEQILNAPAPPYTFSAGPGGPGGGAGAGANGSSGGSGVIIVDEFYAN